MKRDRTERAMLRAQDDQDLCLCRDRIDRLAAIARAGRPLDNDGDWELVMASARLGLLLLHEPATQVPDRVLHGTNCIPDIAENPLVSIGQGDSRRDYCPAPPEPRNPFLHRRRRVHPIALPLWIFMVIGICLGACIAALIDFLFS